MDWKSGFMIPETQRYTNLFFVTPHQVVSSENLQLSRLSPLTNPPKVSNPTRSNFFLIRIADLYEKSNELRDTYSA